MHWKIRIMSNYYYIIPKADFFLQGRGGAVSHVVGAAEGLLDNEQNVFVDGCQGVEEYISNDRLVSRYSTRSRFRIIDDLLNALSVIAFYSKKEGVILHFRKTWSLLVAICLRPICFRSLRRNNKVIFEVNGLSFENRKDFSGKLFFYLSSSLTARVLSGSSLVYVVSESIRDALNKKGCESVVVIPNGSPKYIGSVMSKDGDPGMIFYGKFRAYNEFHVLREAFHLICERMPRFKLYIVGFGPEEGEINRLFNDVSGVSVYGETSLEGISDLICQHAGPICGVVPVRDASGSDFLSPIKLFDYFSLGLPAIVSSSVRLDTYLEECTAVKTYSAGDAESLARTAMSLFDSTIFLSAQLSAKNASYATSWSSRMKQLLDSL